MPEFVCSPADREAWLAARREGVTATDVVALAGLSRYASLYSLYHAKVKGVELPVSNPGRLALGTYLEPHIVDRWAQESAEGQDPDLVIEPSGLWRHDTDPWMLATPDRLVCFDHETRSTGPFPLEVKTWADANRDAWNDSPPPLVRAQALWQMEVLGADRGYVGVLFLPSAEFRSFTLHRKDHEDTIRILRIAGEDLMARMRSRCEPVPDGSAASLAMLRTVFAAVEEEKKEIQPQLWDCWTRAKDELADAEATARRYEALIRQEAGTARILTVGGEKVAVRVTARSQVKAHIRRNDYLRRTPQNGDGDAEG